MSGSKPEELVAKLYEDGMSDDEVREQLTDFGLSGREIRHLIKKAKKLIKEGKTRAKGPAGGPDEEPKSPVPAEPDPMIQQLMKEARESSATSESGPAELEPFEPETQAVPGEETGGFEESKEVEEGVKKPVEKEEKPKKGGFLSGLFKERKKESTEKEERISRAERRSSRRAHDAEYMAKMKRLSMIKEAISKPVAMPKEPEAAPAEKTEEGIEKVPEMEVPLEGATAKEGVEERSEDVEERGDVKETSEKVTTKALTTEEEKKMDEETAKKLMDGMDKLETEMGEIKQLLDTLRELNIKLIELMEKK